MKTIEERARKWVDSQGAGSVHPYNKQAMVDAYIAAYEELTRWNDPKHTPTADVRILIKWRRKKDYREIITVGTYDGRNWSGDSISYPYMFEIIGWREIY